MDFNMLHRANLLSPTTTTTTNSTTNNTNSTNQTVNVILQPKSENTNDEQQEREQETNEEQNESFNPYKTILEGGEVSYNDKTKYSDADDKLASINFLKLIIKAYKNNPVKYNGYIICSIPDLEELIKDLTSCDNCEIDTGEINTGCCGASLQIVPITKIWVRNGETSEIFKYKYSALISTFEQYNISLKFVYID